MPPNTDSEVANPLISYPGKMSQIRAYIYACTSGDKNTNVFSDDEFLAGCNRFSIENPVPSVVVRCALYGNTREIVAELAEAEKKFGKAGINFDAK